MPFINRYLSLLLRRRHSQKECTRTLSSFAEWREAMQPLHASSPRRNTLLVIRLDDIGDYLLFRNQLPTFKRSARWRAHRITLLGNSSWKELFTTFDRDAVDDSIWVNKGEYLTCATYRAQIWAQLRERGFESVIAPSRTRPLLLDDLCRLAAAPTYSIGCANTYVHRGWNDLSDGLYQELFKAPDVWSHEFHFNGQFAAWACGMQFAGNRPVLGAPLQLPVVCAGPGADSKSESESESESESDSSLDLDLDLTLDLGLDATWNSNADCSSNADLICFVGANTRSRRWPARRWIEFIQLYRRSHAGKVILAGSSAAERGIAARIEAQTDAESIVGRVSLLGLVRRIRGARAVLSNDTMAAHLSVSCGRPTVIVANGVNYQRFTDYGQAGMAGVATLYPRVFARRREREPHLLYHYADALTSDIASIAATDVLAALEHILNGDAPEERASQGPV